MAGVCRWLGRALAVAAALFMLAFAQGEPSTTRALTATEVILLVLLIGAVLANVAAWRWELAGAGAALISTLLFAVVELVRNHRLPGPWIIVVMAVPAMFYAGSWLLRHRAPAPA